MITAKSIPNLLTMSRIIVIPFIMWALYAGVGWLALLLFIAASVTDFFDGHLARKLGVKSDFGIFLDPIADKLLVTALILALVDIGVAHIVPACVILLREILISGLREFLGGKGARVPVTMLAKYKTTLQLVALGAFLLVATFPQNVPVELARCLFWAAALLTFITGWQYMQGAMKHLKTK